ncbi:MAG: hypothetical protein N4J56_003364 [Chroococcidiopsis sp. SAG 2025]|nr:hypothetical protein [Chroococcidiopsis sp. SAG 2025]
MLVELRTLAEQYRHTLMEITHEQGSLFSDRVCSWVNSTEQIVHQIESLLAPLDSVNILTKFKELVNKEVISWLGAVKIHLAN